MKIPVSLVLDVLYAAKHYFTDPEEAEAINYAIELVRRDLRKRFDKKQPLFVGKEEKTDEQDHTT